MVRRKNQNTSSKNSSLDKGLEILRRVILDQGQTNIGVLTESMHLTNSTKHRYISTLLENNMILRIGHGRYDIGARLLQATGTHNADQHLAHIARPILTKLAKTLNATTHLGVFENDMVTYLVKSYAHKKAGKKQKIIAAEFTREGGQLEAYCSAIGRVLLSNLPKHELRKYLGDEPFISLTKQTIIDRGELDLIIRVAHEKGFAIDDGEISDDLYCVAVPVTRGNDNMPAALSVSFSKSNGSIFDQTQILVAMKSAAKTISHRLSQIDGKPDR